MADKEIHGTIVAELRKHVSVLERHFRGIVSVDFTVENGELHILSARRGKCSPLANLKIALEMFCEGIIDVDDVLDRLLYNDIEAVLNSGLLTNADELTCIASGIPASFGAATATAVFSPQEVKALIDHNEAFIFCVRRGSPEDEDIIQSGCCLGVIEDFGDKNSHAALACRQVGLPCVTGLNDLLENVKCSLQPHNHITLDGGSGKIYSGSGIIENNNIELPEISMLYELLKLKIKYNAVNSKTAPQVWRLWDIIVFGRRYAKGMNLKQPALKNSKDYRSFSHPSQSKIADIEAELSTIKNGGIIAEDLINFLYSLLSEQVPLGKHFLYMRPLLDPQKTMNVVWQGHDNDADGVQITGIEFFNINQFVDILIDIRSIKVFFQTGFFSRNLPGYSSGKFYHLNYLDYTNPDGEGLIINTCDATKLSIYVNDILLPAADLAMIYHVLRRRGYHWNWYEENNVTRNEIIHHLESHAYLKDRHSKLSYLCEEIGLIEDKALTQTGLSLLGKPNYGQD